MNDDIKEYSKEINEQIGEGMHTAASSRKERR
jgi:hypothetical protein